MSLHDSAARLQLIWMKSFKTVTNMGVNRLSKAFRQHSLSPNMDEVGRS